MTVLYFASPFAVSMPPPEPKMVEASEPVAQADQQGQAASTDSGNQQAGLTRAPWVNVPLLNLASDSAGSATAFNGQVMQAYAATIEQGHEWANTCDWPAA